MDISAPHRPAPAPAAPPAEKTPTAPAVSEPPAQKTDTPSPSLPVREAPVSTEPESQKTDDQSAKPESSGEPEPDSAPKPSPTPRPHDKTSLPVGAIVGTIFAMAALSAVAVLIYLKTQ